MPLFRRAARLANRLASTRLSSTTAYTLHSHGPPSSALTLDAAAPPGPPQGASLRVKWLAAGVDPLDLALVRGDTPSAQSTSLPTVPGAEGVAVVDAIGPAVAALKPGDFVIPVKTSVGTWREAAVVEESHVMAVPSTVPIELAATLSASPFTALRLLQDFAPLAPGDVIVQNDASSAVGTAVVQIASAMGVKTVCLVDESAADYAPTVERLKLMGADVVIGESHATSLGFKAVLADMAPPKLGLNGAGAQSCALVAALVGKGGVVVTHSSGTADGKAIRAKGLSAESFSLGPWLDDSPRSEVEKMVNTLVGMIEDGKLTAWLQRVKFAELAQAIIDGGMTRRKLVALMPAAESV